MKKKQGTANLAPNCDASRRNFINPVASWAMVIP